MSRIQLLKTLFAMAGLLALQALPAAACSACYGASDSPLAAGMNAGIFALLAVVMVVLGGFAAFFVFLVRRAAAMAAESEGVTSELLTTTHKA